MNGKELSAALRTGAHVYGTAILSSSPLWPKVVASTGVDFVFIDTEHTPLNRETVSWMCQTFQAYDIAPVVRIPSPDPYQASMALDGGATGIIAPYIETPEEVLKLAGAVKHKPVKGKRTEKLLLKQEAFEPGLSHYLTQCNEENVLIINVESVPAMEALDEILSVDGLDGVLIGPHDLTCSLGIPEQYQHPLFRRSVETILEKARKKNIGAGVHMWEAVGFDQEIRWAKLGANLIMHSSDLLIFKNGLIKHIDTIKEALK